VYGQGGFAGVGGLTTNASNQGVWGGASAAASSGGAGVMGVNNATSGAGYGVHGTATASPNGVGVLGEGSTRGVSGSATGAGTNYGVYGTTGSTSGYGVYGAGPSFATGTGVYGTGSTGVNGYSSDASGFGVYGVGNTGVYGLTPNTTGGAVGVMGTASGASGAIYGVYGQSASTTGYGVYGTASAASGVNYGVYGTTASVTNGWAGYFNGRTFASSLRVGTSDFNPTRTLRYQIDATEIASYSQLYGIPISIFDSSSLHPGYSVHIGDNSLDMAIPIHIPFNSSAPPLITGFHCRAWQYTASAVSVAILSDPTSQVYTTGTIATTGAYVYFEGFAPADFVAFTPNSSYGAKLVISYTGAGTIDPLYWLFCYVEYQEPGFE
jgi:hypothetical protein